MVAASGLALAAAGAVAPVVARADRTGLEGIPAYQHVFVVIEENESFATTFGPQSPAKYLNQLAQTGAFADQYYGTGHVSLDNYIAMVSGQSGNPATYSDCAAVSLWECVQPQDAIAGGRHLGDQLDAAAVTWKEYADGTTQPCVHDTYDPTSPQPDRYQGNGGTPAGNGAGPDYADRHNPFLYFSDVIGNPARCAAHERPFTELAGDIAADTVPGFSFITPDTCHDGHDSPCSGGGPGGLVSADAWLSAQLPAVLDYASAHDGLVIVTFDEGSPTGDDSGCCHGGPGGQQGFGGRVGLIALGPGVNAGQTVHTAYDHASLLRTLEDSFGISEHLNNAANSAAMADLFAPATTVPDGVAGVPALLALAVPAALAAGLWRRRRARAEAAG